MRAGDERAWTRGVRRPAPAALAFLLLAGCGGSRAQGEEAALAAVRKETERLRGEVAELRVQLEVVRRGGIQHADRAAGEVRREVEAVQGVLQAATRDGEQRQHEALAAEEKRLGAIEAGLTDLAGTARRLEASVGGLADQVGRLSPPAGRPPAAPAAAAVVASKALFDRGMQAFRKADYAKAVLDFEELVQAHPADPLAGTAQFWIGETYFKAGDLERAAIEYRKAVEIAPQGRERPQALLRLGLAYRAGQRESEARQAWAQLLREYPKSEPAQRARRALGER